MCFVPGVCSPLDISDPREVPGHRLPLQQPTPRQASDRGELSHLSDQSQSLYGSSLLSSAVRPRSTSDLAGLILRIQRNALSHPVRNAASKCGHLLCH